MCVEKDFLLRVEPFIIVRRYTYKAFGNVHVVCNKARGRWRRRLQLSAPLFAGRALTRRDDRWLESLVDPNEPFRTALPRFSVPLLLRPHFRAMTSRFKS